MNKTLRRTYLQFNYSLSEAFLRYLRENKAFSHMSGNHDGDANPYWWGSTYEYSIGSEVLKNLIENKSLKISRLKIIINDLKEDLNSPIVRLVGLHLERELKKYC